VETYHEVFEKPLRLDLPFEEVPTPERYLTSPGARGLGPAIVVWRVQTKKSPEIDPGDAYEPVGVEDSPDAEVISGGIQTNGSYAMAIARQGNFLFWGFYAQPSDMTPEARKAFVNAVCYIRRFDGQKPLVQAKAASRERFRQQAQFLTTTSDKEAITYLLMAFPSDLRRQFGSRKEKYAEYYEKDLEFLYCSDVKEKGLTKKAFLVDEDLKSLNLSNRKVETLDVCVGMLEKGEKMDVARRILKRYVAENFSTAAEWRKWLTENRDYLFFSDVGGYRWYVDTLAKGRGIPTEQLRGPARANVQLDSAGRH